MTDKIIIRASSLGTHADCMARGVAQAHFKKLFTAGYDLNPPRHAVGAALGTAVHAGVCHDLERIRDGLARPSCGDVVALAVSEFSKQIADKNTVYDDLTKNVNDAHRQIRAMATTHHETISPVSRPVYVEKRMNCYLNERVLLTGQPDSVELHSVQDIKTGRRRSHIFQLGAYGILSEANGLEINRAEIIGIPRPSKNKPVQVYREEITGGILHHGTIPAIYSIVDRITDALDTVKRGNPVLDVNPGSSMCSRVMCPAWGKRFCIATYGKE